jgi:hypothetical protein
MRHPEAMPWWRRVVEVGDYRLLWCEWLDYPPAISLHKRGDDGRYRFQRIFFDSLGDLEQEWRDGEAYMQRL